MSSGYFCNIFERCDATHQIKGEAEGEKARGCRHGRRMEPVVFAVGGVWLQGPHSLSERWALYLHVCAFPSQLHLSPRAAGPGGALPAPLPQS